MEMTLSLAQALTEAARRTVAQGALPPVSVCIVDAAAHPVAFARMDGTFIGASDVAHRKARTAALFRSDSAQLGAHLRPDGAAYSLDNSNGGLIGFGGGVVVRAPDGSAIGAIGISGGSVEQDELIAQAAAAAVLIA
jgi:uncharacterized protein GlcG (DUF336 family)